MPLSVIIVNWNGGELLENCVRTLFLFCSSSIHEIILVDNFSEDNSVAAIRQRFPQVRIIENKENLGFVKANNQGIKATNNPYVLILNPDTWVINDCVGDMLRAIENNPQVAVVGPKVLNPDMSLQGESLVRYPSLSRYFVREFHLENWIKNRQPLGSKLLIDVDAVSGCCMLVRKNVLDEVGGFDEKFWAYSEETDLCLRLKKKGWRVCLLPNSSIIHIGGESFRKMPLRRMVEQRKSQYYFFKKHYWLLRYVTYACTEILMCFGKWLILNFLFTVSHNEYYAQRKNGFLQIGRHIVLDIWHSFSC